MTRNDGPEPKSRIAVSAVQVLAFVVAYWRQVPLRMTLMVLGIGLGIGLETQIPQLSAALVLATERQAEATGTGYEVWRAAAQLVGMFAAVFLVKQLYLRNWMRLASSVMQRLVADGFRRVQRFSHEWHTSHFAGSTQRKITRGMWAYDSLADTLIIDLGPGLGLLLGFTVAMTLREPLLGAYFGLGSAVFVGSSVFVSLRYVAPANVASNAADTAIGGAIADAITCNSVVKSFGAEQREDARFGQTSERWRNAAHHAWRRSMDAGAIQSVLLLLLLGGLIALCLLRPGSDGRSLDNTVYVITTYLLVHSYLRNIGWQVRNAQRAVNELEDLVEISLLQPDVEDLPNAPDLVPAAGSVRFENVGFGYANQPTRLFDGLSLEIPAGQRVALVGESGAGKSTFTKLLQRLYDPHEGRILVDGQDVRRVTQHSLRGAISVVPQDPILFHRSLAENIGYARPDATPAQVREAAGRARADHFIQGLEHGYDTLVGERGVKLSGGERQRVAIARAILADAPILVLDEATSSLDSGTERLIQDALLDLMRGRTSLVIAHRLSTVRQVDRILVFDQGRIVEDGSHDELMALPHGRYRALVRIQGLADDHQVPPEPEQQTA